MEQATQGPLVRDTPVKVANMTINGLGLFVESKVPRLFFSWEVLEMYRKIAMGKPNFHATEPDGPTGIVEWREGGPLPNG